jgi:hypothetical protein
MSFSRWRNNRGRASRQAGFLVGAAFVVAFLLSVAGIAVQTSFPIDVALGSQSAALEAGVSGASTITTANPDGAVPSEAASNVSLAANTTPASSQTKAPPVPGMDMIEILISGQQEVNLYFPVCPVKPPDQSTKMKQAAKQLQTIPVSNGSQSQFGMPGTRCKPDPNNATNKTNRLVPVTTSPSAWPQWTLYCEDKGLPGTTSSGSVAPGTTRNITDTDVDGITQDLTNTKYACKMLPPVTQAAASPKVQSLVQQLANTPPEQQPALIQSQNLSAADQSALNQALGQQTDALKTDAANVTAQNNDIINQRDELQALADSGRDCTDENGNAISVASADYCQKRIEDLNNQIDVNKSKIADDTQQIKNLGAAAVTLNPGNNPNPNQTGPNLPQGPCSNGSPIGANGTCGATVTPPPYTGGGQPNPYSGGGGGGSFNNPNLGANNTPQSPFGGACNTRYVCSGNTLYYQSTNPYGMGVNPYSGYNPYGGYPAYPPVVGAGQCMTQPVQQCQYGCQQPYGAGTTGAQSTLGGIMAGLQIVSALSSIFGGSNNNNSNLANNNLPSQCATSPQQSQQQSPYGTGTNGQQCYQPPPQPDPSQCTSGSWQPTSAQQNGCTTGWQCVPGNGSAGGTPTAQLSCQPQIADVGMPISFSFACGNASGSTGTGFSTGGALSGSATTSAPNPPSGQNTVTYTLTCIKLGVTASSQCQVQLNKAGIVLVTNPKNVNGNETSLIGWITSGMQSCVISSPDQQDFTARNAGNTSVNGAATTSPITGNTRFRLDCQTLSGGTKSATTTVSLN